MKTVIATAACHCTGHSGCLHRPGQCPHPVRRSDCCGWCRRRWLDAVRQQSFRDGHSDLEVTPV